MRMRKTKHCPVSNSARDESPSNFFEPLEARLLLSAVTPLDPAISLLQWDGRTLPAVHGEWIGKVADGSMVSVDALASAIPGAGGSSSTFEELGGPGLVLFHDLLIEPEECPALAASLGLEYLEPNFVYYTSDVQESTSPNDPQFSSLWGLHNTGQSGGTADADIDAPEAWDISTGSASVVIAVIDSGVDYTHPDLAANIWTNSGEIPGDGIDNDGNGYIDDMRGWDFAYGDSDPMDVDGHGTHVSGTIGGVGNNSVGVAGVNWNVRLMALKFLDDDGSGYTSDAVEAVNYATMMKRDYGVNVVASNNSWGGGGYSTALRDAIAAAGSEGILFLAAAGNGGWDGIGDDNDVTPHYPSNYDLDNVISVAATDRNDQLVGFSNYGAVSVDLAAPGASILSTLPGGTYGFKNGTSMATPHVSGVVGLLAAANPSATATEIKSAIMAGVDSLPGLAGRCISGGRLNASGALLNIAPLPTVTLAIVDGQAGETLPALPKDTAGFEVTRTGGTSSPLTVHYALNGTALNGSDYEYLSGTLTIPAGSSHSMIVVTPIDDLDVEPTETVLLSLVADTAYVIGGASQAEAALADNDVFLPTITLIVDDRDASETAPGDAADLAIVTVVRSGDISAELIVSYELGGTAQNGVDYSLLPGTVTIPAGVDRAGIVVQPIDDPVAEPTESVAVTILPESFYIIGIPATANLNISDNDVMSELQMELRIVAAPLADDHIPDAAFTAYQSIAATQAGIPYFTEVWLRDVGLTTTGLVGGRVDVVYTESAVSCAALYHGAVFTSATSGQEEPGVGLVDNFGGATSSMGEGASGWVRLGYLEMHGLAAGNVQFQLQQGNVQFGQMSGGNIAWNLVNFGSPVPIEQAGREVDVWLVPQTNATTSDTSATLPASDRPSFWQLEDNDYYVEVWVRSDQASAAAISGGSVNVTFDPQYAQAVGPLDHGGIFTVLPVDNIDNTAGVVSIGGGTLASDMGDDEYVCLGRIKFQDTAPVDEAAHQYGPYDMNLDVANGPSSFALVDTGNVNGDLQPVPYVDVRANIYDIDDSGQVDFGDFSYFSPAFLQVPGGSEPPYAWWADFDKTGWVDFGDFSYFVTAFLKPFSDPSIVFPSWWYDTYVAHGVSEAMAASAATLQPAVEPIVVAAVPVVPVVSQPIRQAHGKPLDDRDAKNDPIAATAPAPAVDLLMPSPGSYIPEPQPISLGLPTTALYRAATAEYDLRLLGDDPASDASGQADDLLADVLEEALLLAVSY